VIYDRNGAEHSLPENSFTLFKGASHPDKNAALIHKAPFYATAQMRDFYSTLSR
jgi:hypothetical protein